MLMQDFHLKLVCAVIPINIMMILLHRPKFNGYLLDPILTYLYFQTEKNTIFIQCQL